MIDRVLMVTRKMTIKLQEMQITVEMMNNELNQYNELLYEQKIARDLLAQVKEFRNDIEDLEHVVLAEGIR